MSRILPFPPVLLFFLISYSPCSGGKNGCKPVTCPKCNKNLTLRRGQTEGGGTLGKDCMATYSIRVTAPPIYPLSPCQRLHNPLGARTSFPDVPCHLPRSQFKPGYGLLSIDTSTFSAFVLSPTAGCCLQPLLLLPVLHARLLRNLLDDLRRILVECKFLPTPAETQEAR